MKSIEVCNGHVCCNGFKGNLGSLCNSNCEKCSYDVDKNHYPNNKDCSFYKPVKVFVVDVKPSSN